MFVIILYTGEQNDWHHPYAARGYRAGHFGRDGIRRDTMTIIALFALVCVYSWILARIADKPTPKPDGFVLPDFETARRNRIRALHAALDRLGER